MPTRPNKIAVIALCLSIGTATFSIYQWWHSEVELRNKAAIDFSLKYLQDSDIRLAVSEWTKAWEENRDGPALYEPPANYVSSVEYVAFLINIGKLSEDYVAPIIKCDMLMLTRFSASKAIAIDFPIPEINKLKGRLSENNCSRVKKEN